MMITQNALSSTKPSKGHFNFHVAKCYTKCCIHQMKPGISEISDCLSKFSNDYI